MRIYETGEGERFVVVGSRDLIRQMRKRSPHREANKQAWMRGIGRRVFQTTGFRIQTTSDAAFVAGLLRSGLLKEAKE
jgi:hypothetical protein